MRTRLRTAAGHLTLAAAQSLFVALSTLVLSVCNLPYMFPGAVSGAGIKALAAVLIADAVVLGPLLVTRAIGRPRSMSPAALFLALLILGAVRVVVLGGLMTGLGIVGVDWRRLALSGALFGGVLLLLVTAVDAVQRAVRRQQRTEWLMRAIDSTQAGTEAVLQEDREAAVADVRGAVLAALERLSQQSPVAAAHDLRAVALRVVRPLSHALVAAPPLVVQPVKVTQYRLDVRTLLSASTEQGRLPAVGLGLALTTVSLGYHSVMPNGGLPWQASLLAGVALAGFSALSNRLLARRISRLAAVPRALAMTGLLCGMGVAVFLTFKPAAEATGQFLMSNLVVTPVAGWSLLIARAVAASHGESRARVQALEDRLAWALARSNARLRAQRRELARILHGPLQAGLNAAVVRVERTEGPTVGEPTAREVTCSACQALDELALSGEPAVNLAVALQRTQGIWRGLCDVRLVDPDHQVLAVQADPVAAQSIADIITEGCSNAARHGDATTVTVELTRPKSDIVRVRIVDDGNGLGRDAQPGLGTAFLQSATLAWERTGDRSGTVLQADVPTSIGRVNPVPGPTISVRVPEQSSSTTTTRPEGWHRNTHMA